jgi:hypothetical protein
LELPSDLRIGQRGGSDCKNENQVLKIVDCPPAFIPSPA